MTESKKHVGGRKRTGQLIWRPSGWYARFWTVVDGEEVRVSRPLGTTDKAVARRKLARLLSGKDAPTPEAVQAIETVDAYATAWLDGRDARKIVAAVYERDYYERIWKPAIGHLALDAVTAGMVRGVLGDLANGKIRRKPRKPGAEAEPYSRQTISHIRATAFRLFQAAWREELISENRVARVTVPEVDEEEKPRAVLTDLELAQFVAHPAVDFELKVLVLLSRTVGGMRAGDLNALTWHAFSPDFGTCTFVRQKTRKKKKKPTAFDVPEAVRPFIREWHERAGSPKEGPVFPIRRGTHLGEHRKAANTSYADALRRALLRAGVDRHELHVETPTTLPVDFHSTRRAYSQALARAGVNEQTAMALTGHADSAVHKRYLESVALRVLPAAAVPALPKFDAEHWAATVPFDSKREHVRAQQDTGIARRAIGFES